MSATTKIDLCAWALKYAELGWRVIPLHNPLTKEGWSCSCEIYKRSDRYRQWLESKGMGAKFDPDFVCGKSAGKHPRFSDWESKASSDPEQIRAWWKKWPSANIGIAAGRSGLLEIDGDKYKDDYAGDDLLSLDEKVTPTVLSGGGGENWVYLMPPGKTYSNEEGDLPAGINIRGHGGQFVAPPSLHASGERYRWEEGYSPWDIAPAPLPGKIADILDAAQSGPTKPVNFSAITTEKPDLNQWHLSAWELGKIGTPAPVGERSDADFGVCKALIKAGATDDDILAVFEHYPIGVDGKFAEDGRGYLARTIANARRDAEHEGVRVYVNGHTAAHATQATKPTLDAILSAIEEIAAGDPAQIPERIARELGGAVGELDRSLQVAVVAALVNGAGFTKTAAQNFVRDCAADAKRRRQEAKHERYQAAQAERIAERKTKRAGRLSIDVNRQLITVVNDAAYALVEYNADEPTIFVRGGALARVVRDEDGAPTIQQLNAGALLHTLGDAADWVLIHIGDDGGEVVDVFPPADVVRAVLSAGAWPGIPAIEGVVNAPTFAPDGTLHDAPGYNPATRLYNASSLALGDTTPTPANVAAAKSLIVDDLLHDFPFKDQASRTHAVALLLLPFVRPMIAGATPLHLIDAPTPGSGKGLLTAACALPAIGRDVHSLAPGENEDEWRKRLTATLLMGGTHISIDNIRKPLDSGVLSSVLTQEYVEDRILGQSANAKLKVRAVWCANGNNIMPSDEIARRSVWIRLDANAEKPWERDGFKHPNLRAWILENRAAIVTAAVTLVRAWIDAGQPAYTGRGKGSYDDWSRVMGGILHTVGIAGFLGNENDLFDTAVSDAEVLREFVKAWWERHGDSPVASGELFKLASKPDDGQADDGDWLGLLDGILGNGNQRSRQTRLGKILAGAKDKVYGDYKIRKDKTVKGVPHWGLSKTGVERSTPRSTQPDAIPTPVSDDYAKDWVERGRTLTLHDACENLFFSGGGDDTEDASSPNEKIILLG